MTVTLVQQIKCVEREIGMRQRVYPRWIEAKRMTQKKADEEIAAMQAVLETLRSIEQPGLPL
jgi:hypothetical protein